MLDLLFIDGAAGTLTEEVRNRRFRDSKLYGTRSELNSNPMGLYNVYRHVHINPLLGIRGKVDPGVVS